MARPLVTKPLLIAIAASAAIHLVAVLVPSLQPVFKTYPVSSTQWLMVLGLAALVLPAVELAKLVYRMGMAWARSGLLDGLPLSRRK